jgi:hypothetical protein
MTVLDPGADWPGTRLHAQAADRRQDQGAAGVTVPNTNLDRIRCDGSISAPTLVASVNSTSFFTVTGDNTRL